MLINNHIQMIFYVFFLCIDPEAASDAKGRVGLPPNIVEIVTPAKPKENAVYEGPMAPSRKNTGIVEEFVL